MRVLIVDDEPLELLNVRSILSSYDSSVDILTAENGMEAVTILERETIDLVCLDIRMPGWDGIETLQRIKPNWPDVKVLLISAHSEFHYAQEAINLGASGYILKPVVSGELVQSYVKLAKEIKVKRTVKPLLMQAIVGKWLGIDGLNEELVNTAWKADSSLQPNLVIVFKTEDPRMLAEKADLEHELGQMLTDALFVPGCIEGYSVYLLRVASDEQLQFIRESLTHLKLEWKRKSPNLRWSYGVGETVESPCTLKKSLYTAIHEAKNKEESIVQQCIEFMVKHYASDITLHDVALKVHMSPSHLSRIFNKRLGVTFVVMLTKIRIEMAKELLDNPNLSIEFISHSVGFSSPNYFASTFRKLQGQSPRQYRINGL